MPRTYRACLIGCGRMGATIDDEVEAVQIAVCGNRSRTPPPLSPATEPTSSRF